MQNIYFTSQISLSAELIELIDNYMKNQINNKKIKSSIIKMVNNNYELMFYENGQIKAIVKQRLGKKRERILLHIIEEMRSV